MMRSTSVLFREDLSPTPALDGTTSYSYDTRNELLNETSARNGGYSNAFGYDGAENPTTFKGAPNTFNTDNQNVAFTFDGNGNPTTYKGTALGFDPENRLTSYGTTMTAGYDGDSLRAWKSTTSGKTYYVYDGDSPVLELNSSGTVTAFNVWGANGLLSRRTGTTSVYYTFDPQGSVVQRLDANENILSASAYDAWGNPLVPNPNDPFGYDAQWGYYTDNETGLLLLTHRYYDPTQGRFLTRDPIGVIGGVNVYGYAGNQVINGIDPEGWSFVKPDKKKCEEWANELIRLEGILEKRLEDMLKDENNYYANHDPSWRKHQETYEDIRKSENELLRKYTKFCGDPPPYIRYAFIPAPERPSRMQSNDSMKIIVIGAGCGYAAWEIIKWGGAIVLAPETGGFSCACAALAP